MRLIVETDYTWFLVGLTMAPEFKWLGSSSSWYQYYCLSAGEARRKRDLNPVFWWYFGTKTRTEFINNFLFERVFTWLDASCPLVAHKQTCRVLKLESSFLSCCYIAKMSAISVTTVKGTSLKSEKRVRPVSISRLINHADGLSVKVVQFFEERDVALILFFVMLSERIDVMTWLKGESSYPWVRMKTRSDVLEEMMRRRIRWRSWEKTRGETRRRKKSESEAIIYFQGITVYCSFFLSSLHVLLPPFLFSHFAPGIVLSSDQPSLILIFSIDTYYESEWIASQREWGEESHNRVTIYLATFMSGVEKTGDKTRE